MSALLIATAAKCVLSVTLAWTAEKEVTYIDLDPKANQKVAENEGDPGNDLSELPKGEQTIEGAKFRVGKGLIQLRGKFLPDRPEKVEGIKVDKAFAKLYILHATGWGAPEGARGFVPDDTLIAQYTVHYEDKSAEVIEVVYGQDVRDWWDWDMSKAVTRGKLAWTGNNQRATQNNVTIRLFLATWKNPNPDKKVTSIDYLTTSETPAAPFCVAMTAESK
jgi:hypothetical protein